MLHETPDKVNYEEEEIEIRVQAYLDCNVVQICGANIKGTLVLLPDLPKESLIEYAEIIYDAILKSDQFSSIDRTMKPL